MQASLNYFYFKLNFQVFFQSKFPFKKKVFKILSFKIMTLQFI